MCGFVASDYVDKVDFDFSQTKIEDQDPELLTDVKKLLDQKVDLRRKAALKTIREGD